MQQNPGSFLLTNTIGSVNHYNLLQLSQVASNMRRADEDDPLRPQKRRHTVSPSIRSFMHSRLTGAVAALWLCCAGPAWAGDGGNDLGTLNNGLADLCSSLENTFGV